MADNVAKYGLRPYQANGAVPKAQRMSVASGYDGVDNAAASVVISPGDPVKLVSTGTVALCQDTEACWGVVQSVLPYWNAAEGVMTPSRTLPNQVVWGTIEERRYWLMVVPVNNSQWEIDCDDATTATTFTAYQLLVGQNVEVKLNGNTTLTTAKPQCDISTVATTGTLIWRIEGISQSEDNKDFSGANVKVVLSCNVSQAAGQADPDELAEGV